MSNQGDPFAAIATHNQLVGGGQRQPQRNQGPEMVLNQKDEEKLKRIRIPSRESVGTEFSPLGDLVMIVPLISPDKVGDLYLPDRMIVPMTEGHVVECGPHCTGRVEVGDLVMWNEPDQWRMNIDGIKFVLVGERSIIMRVPRAKLSAELELWQGQGKPDAPENSLAPDIGVAPITPVEDQQCKTCGHGEGYHDLRGCCISKCKCTRFEE